MHKKGLTPLETMQRREKILMSLTGLTLMEVIIASVILAVVLAGSVNVFLAAKRLVLHSRSRMAAAELGRFFLEDLSAQISEDGWQNSCVGANLSCPGIPDAIALPPENITYTPAITSAPVAGTSLRSVTFTISWTEQ